MKIFLSFERFNGQWALALWDAREKKVILSRGVNEICNRGTMEF